MSILEGKLESRGGGVLAKWQEEWYRLVEDRLEVYRIDDTQRSEPVDRILLRDLSSILLDEDKNECVLTVGNKKVRLRAATEEETKKWTKQIQEHAGIFIQVDTISKLPRLGQGSKYIVTAKFKGTNSEQQQTTWCQGTGKNGAETEDCNVRQQLYLLAPDLQKAVVILSVERRPVDSNEASEREFLGSCELPGASVEVGKPIVHKLLTKEKEESGITIRLKVRVGGTALQGRDKGSTRASAANVTRASAANVTRASAANVTRASAANVTSAPAANATKASAANATKATAADATMSRNPPDVEGAEEVLDAITQVMADKGLRVSDLFRSAQYNPKYAKTKSEELKSKDVATILRNAGVDIEESKVSSLVALLDKDGSRSIDIRELEVVMRDKKRGALKWDLPSAHTGNSKLEFKRKLQTPEENNSEPSDPRKVLDAISSLLDVRRLRVTDIFRHPQYNPSYLKTGDEELDAEEVSKVLGKAGLEIPLRDIRNMMQVLDGDGNGVLSIDELEAALRAHRRGQNVNSEAFQKSIKKAATQKRYADLDRLHQMHAEHQEKLVRLKQMKEDRELAEVNQIATEAHQLKESLKKGLPKRNDASDDDFEDVGADEKKIEIGERLYKDSRLHDKRMVKLARKLEEEENKKLNEARFRPQGRSSSEPRILTRKEAKEVKEARMRQLYCKGTESRDERQRRKEAQVADEITQLDKVGKRAVTRTSSSPDVVLTQRHEKLYDDGAKKAARLQKKSADRLQQEQLMIEHEINKRREKLGVNMKGLDEKRIDELYQEYDKNILKRTFNLKTKIEQEQASVAKSADEAKNNPYAEHYEKVQARYNDPPKQQSPATPSKNDMPKQHAFGSSVTRKLAGGEVTKSAPLEEVKAKGRRVLDLSDHAVRVINSAVSLRCACGPSDATEEMLKQAKTPVKAAIQLLKDAIDESDTQGDAGAVYLRLRPSQRLFANGQLLDEPVGRHQCCEPDPILQMESDLDKLLQDAEKAQAVLLSQIGPEESSSEAAGTPPAQMMRRRWPAGAKWQAPRVAHGKARFAYNPGPKSRDAAIAKAFVRFAPADPEGRYQHLLDLARASIVFANSRMLRAGLEHILAEFEVVAVRNHYHPSLHNIIGSRCVDVYVVISDEDETFTPHICEIRLEEMGFHLARAKVHPHLDQIAEIFCKFYEHRKTIKDPKAIRYLAQWVLFRPKDSHGAIVFRRHLARRYGSTVNAWRMALGDDSLVDFLTFRQCCQNLAYRDQTVEYWSALDAGLAGNISLFELDSDAVMLLAKFYGRLMGLVSNDSEADVDTLFAKLTIKSAVKLSKQGSLEAHEFRQVVKPLGFGPVDADLLFCYLDSKGGANHAPPATVTLDDIAWLSNLPALVDIDSVMLTPEDAATMVEALRIASADTTTGRRARMPSESPCARGSTRTSVFLSLSMPESVRSPQPPEPGEMEEE
eukprot:CAMPEP_0115207678 /NCGR_PEP_ID=MMETSP0270-20121206/20838_1 /TAXON_ID=71861 /ORGANISM="Scrippsiella trochoidea, Strain CCMP3099" /LENGTH=1441 /DNA_ID=CAMNT_0002621275 /DNA_START=33 /DNA_END=4355 /DNA_ORIENTATION=+